MKRNWMQLMFSFEGRIPRSDYWWGLGATIALFGGTVLIGVAINAIFKLFELEAMGRILAGVPIFLVAIAAMWAWFALGVKRLHDHGLSGWWMIAGRIPIIGPIGLFIVLGLLRGTIGTNRFGVDSTLEEIFARQYG